MDSTTYNFGPLVVQTANFAGPLDGLRDVNIRTACWGYGRDVPSQGFCGSFKINIYSTKTIFTKNIFLSKIKKIKIKQFEMAKQGSDTNGPTSLTYPIYHV